MKQSLLLLTLIISLFVSGNQQTKRDSLVKILEQQSGLLKAQTFIQLSNLIVYSSPKLALTYADEAMLLADSANEISTRYQALKARAYANGYLGNIAQSMQDMQEGLFYYQQIYDSVKISEAISDLGYLNEVQANFDVALGLYQQSLNIREKINDEKGMAYSLNNIGAVYSKIGKNNDALDYYTKAVAIFRKMDLKEELAIIFGNIGVIYLNQNSYKKALEQLNQAKELNQILGNKIYEAKTINNIGKVYLAKKNYLKAQQLFNEALQIQEKANDKDGMALSNFNLGNTYFLQNRYFEAQDYLQKSIEISTQINNFQLLVKAFKTLAQTQYQLKNFQDAYQNLSHAKSIEDSLFTIEKNRQIEEVKTKYETEKHRIEISNLKQLNSDNELIIKQQELQLIYGVLIAGLLILSIWLLFQRKQWNDHRKAIELEQRLLRSQMNPHFIFNSITAIQSYILKNSTRDAVNYLSSFASLMRLILENSSTEFISFEKEIQTLKFYMELQQQRFADRFNFELHIDPNLMEEGFTVPPMITQPFIENAIEHGFSQIQEKGIINIRYQLKNNQLICEVEDNGIGIDHGSKNNIKERKTFGIEITKQRIHILEKKHHQKLSFEIIDKQQALNQQGTLIRITLPILKKS